MKRIWTKISERETFSTPYFSITTKRFTDGLGYEDDFYAFNFTDWVHVVPVMKDGRVLLIKQFRFGVEEYLLEFPGGQVKKGDSPLETCKKELMEETGGSSPNIISLGYNYPNPATHINKCWYFLALDCEITGETEFDPAEEIEISYISKEELLLSYKEILKHSLAEVAFSRAKDYF